MTPPRRSIASLLHDDNPPPVPPMPSNALVLPLDLDAVDALANAATAGPWCVDEYANVKDAKDDSGFGWCSLDLEGCAWKLEPVGAVFQLVEETTTGRATTGLPGSIETTLANARFIAAARTLVPALVARVRELESALDEANAHLAWAREDGKKHERDAKRLDWMASRGLCLVTHIVGTDRQAIDAAIDAERAE